MQPRRAAGIPAGLVLRRAHLQEDGELSDELRLAFEECSQEQERSLDELLEFQQGWSCGARSLRPGYRLAGALAYTGVERGREGLPVRLRRQNLPWLIITGAMLGLALLPGTATAGLAAALLGCGALALASSLTLKPGVLTAGRLREALPAMPRAVAGAQVSAAARAATERARRHSGSGLTPGLTLLDIGLISAQLGPDGMSMRKGGSFSGDDDGLRPYLSLQVPNMKRSAAQIFALRSAISAAKRASATSRRSGCGKANATCSPITSCRWGATMSCRAAAANGSFASASMRCWSAC